MLTPSQPLRSARSRSARRQGRAIQRVRDRLLRDQHLHLSALDPRIFKRGRNTVRGLFRLLLRGLRVLEPGPHRSDLSYQGDRLPDGFALFDRFRRRLDHWPNCRCHLVEYGQFLGDEDLLWCVLFRGYLGYLGG